jgi:integrase
MDAARNYWRPTVALVLETLAYTGMRLGECLAMHRDNLDAGNSQYMVKETVRNGKFGEPKTGRRLIDLMEENAKSLQSHILNLRRESMSQGIEIGYLFPAFTQRVIQRALERACRTAKVRIRSPHGLRHTYATLLLMDHYSPVYVARCMFRSSLAITRSPCPLTFMATGYPAKAGGIFRKPLREASLQTLAWPQKTGPR